LCCLGCVGGGGGGGGAPPPWMDGCLPSNVCESSLPALEMLVNAVLHVILRHRLVLVQDRQVFLKKNSSSSKWSLNAPRKKHTKSAVLNVLSCYLAYPL
jgi:hypothetical protein